ncbi:MAG: bifunctional UDP-N-acetylglucosamine diphosphorylase/glucosamine-1-phosphate N-acetyltransferase GlmU [Nitrospira sp.]|nr:bifunctional UDP-N-acetylglucosamine diphosphorylase/glucosamine-1-phosphate N-acetyltransferase GlmU [Nitrospira sp.]
MSRGASKDLGAIVMAAGLGKRMKSKLAKVLHPVAGRPMVLYAVDLAHRMAGECVAVVVGYQGKGVCAALEASGPRQSVMIVEQAQQLGTGHAVQQTRDVFKRLGKALAAYVILNGDTPLLRAETVEALLRLHRDERAVVTLLTATLDDSAGYGHVVRAQDGSVQKIVEDKDATATEKQSREINVGTYVVDGPFLFEALATVQPTNAQGEYYLTDLVGVAVERGMRVSTLTLADANEGMGINTREQLAQAERTIRRRICAQWMAEGVTLRDPATTVIDAGVAIGRDTVIHPDVTLEGCTAIGEDCIIRSRTRISDSRIGHRVVVQDQCVIREATLEDDTAVGPFAHLRPGAVLRRAAKVGNFVEMKKAELGEGSKANHLTYLGDATIGKGVNIGAGTITCNYDGRKKHETVIGNDVFVGSDVQFIAPVTVGTGAVIAAGTTVTSSVPQDTLAIARTQQVNHPGWAARRRAVLAGGVRKAVFGKGQAKSERDMRRAPRVTGTQTPSAKKKFPVSRTQKTEKRRRG